MAQEPESSVPADRVARSLSATHALLAQIEQDNRLLADPEFMAKLAYLRQQHRQTASELGRMRTFPGCASLSLTGRPILPPSSLPPPNRVGLLLYDQLQRSGYPEISTTLRPEELYRSMMALHRPRSTLDLPSSRIGGGYGSYESLRPPRVASRSAVRILDTRDRPERLNDRPHTLSGAGNYESGAGNYEDYRPARKADDFQLVNRRESRDDYRTSGQRKEDAKRDYYRSVDQRLETTRNGDQRRREEYRTRDQRSEDRNEDRRRIEEEYRLIDQRMEARTEDKKRRDDEYRRSKENEYRSVDQKVEEARSRLEERRSREERMEDDYRPRRDRKDHEDMDSSEERKHERRPVTVTAEREKARRWRSASDLREVRKKEEEARRERRKQHWIPALTEPRPFTMSTREPIRARYSQQFVDQLVEKRRKEEEERKGDEEKQMKYKFHAVPVPESTYTPTNPRVLREEYVEAVRARTQQRLARWKSKSSDELWVAKSRPVPLSTYIPPKSYAMSRSKSAHERALRLLTEASTPPGLKEHEARTHVRTALRHRPCTGDYSHHPVPTSIPNFKELHRRFEEKMGDAQYKPPTVPVPFNFTHGTGKKTHEKCIEEEIAEKRADARPITKHSPSPVRKTQASEMRERAIREKLELRTSEVVRTEERKREERDRFLRNAHRLKALVGERKSVEDEIRVKAEQKRRELVERQRDYEKSLREMKDRVEDRPLVVERQGIISSQQALQKRFDQVMKNADTAISQPVTIEKRERKEGDREESEESGGTFDVKREELKEGKDYKDDFEADSSSSSMKTSSSSTSSSSSKKKTSPTSSKQIGLSNDNDDSSSSSVSSPSSSGHSSPKRSPSKLSNITERTETSEH